MQTHLTNSLDSSTADTLTNVKNVQDYFQFLLGYEVVSTSAGYYLQVGKIEDPIGWILHVSVIRSQLEVAIETIVPLLVKENVSFKVAVNSEIAKLLLDGSLGYTNLGKVICIYPRNEGDALSLAKKLISITQNFSGPDIPTDFNLLGVVFTCHGTLKEKVPFAMPKGMLWPFDDIKPCSGVTPSKLLNQRYKPIAVIKPDAKGRVMRGIYMQKIFLIKPCLIKEGKKHMWADDEARDIQTRLQWQKEVHDDLEGIVSIPKVIDLFMEHEDMYLVMEFIKGVSLDKIISEINRGDSWFKLPLKGKLALIDYILRIIVIIENMHRHGYVHRDISPANFLIDKNNKIHLIDLELSYSLKARKPLPPYKLGTSGFMSPEQQAIEVPTILEDIYGLGALMVLFFTGLPPIKFDTSHRNKLEKCLHFFTRSSLLSCMISSCMDHCAQYRPPLSAIQATIERYRLEIQKNIPDQNKQAYLEKPDHDAILELIDGAIKGLGDPIMMTTDKLWSSLSIQSDNWIGTEQVERTYLCGIYSGLSGVLYFLAQAKMAGFDIGTCLEGYTNSWEYIQEKYLGLLSEVGPGLCEGAAGIALSINSGLEAELLPREERQFAYLSRCFEQTSKQLDVSTGVAGQGLALLRCSRWLGKVGCESRINQYVNILLSLQLKDGSWPVTIPGRNGVITGFAFGIAGIISFLMEYLTYEEEANVISAVIKGLKWLTRQSIKKSDTYFWNTTSKSKEIDNWSLLEGVPGIIKCYLKAYEYFKDPLYKNITKGALSELPSFPVRINFTQARGLSGLGEIYIEAYKVLKEECWNQRAAWIAGTIQHCAIRTEKGYPYWSLDAGNNPVADFMIGTTGIIHFLMRYVSSKMIGHPFFSYK